MRTIRPGLVFLLLALAGFAAAACGGDDGDEGGGASSIDDYLGAQVTPFFEKPDLVLTDTEGRPFDIRKDTEGFLTILYVGYTHCPDICPTTMYDISEVLKTLTEKQRSQIKVVFATADPDRDTPEVIRKWLDHFDTTFIGLSGDSRQISDLLKQLLMGTPQRTDLGEGNYAVSHAAYAIAYTKDNTGRLVYPFGITQDDWKHDLPMLVNETWK
ncbi:MAG: SCO family protein [Chloroflexi bacterium]|nr:SCO family protein [Chloroflexota bacterium]